MSMQGGEYSTERLLGVGRLGFGLGTSTHNLVGTERQPVAAESNFCRRRRVGGDYDYDDREKARESSTSFWGQCSPDERQTTCISCGKRSDTFLSCSAATAVVGRRRRRSPQLATLLDKSQ